MRQIAQDLATGATVVVECPRPGAGRGQVVSDTRVSLISAGTERMLVEFGRSSLAAKARRHPDKVRQVIEKVGTDGLLTTVDAVRSKLDQPLPLGYSNVGVVAEVGTEVDGLRAGDRIVSNGAHAEAVAVPVNLCAKVPDSVSDEAAAFTVVGSIALQGIRLANPTLGESVVVIGTGLIGLVAVQLLRASGCRVLAVDLDDARLELAAAYGAETCNPQRDDIVACTHALTNGIGADAVIIAAATASNQPVADAAQISRKRGRIVLVGVTGLGLNRDDFYAKELSFQVSCSYGPGRYDPAYEQLGHDYPVGFVRWTAQRNFDAVLAMLTDGRLDVSRLVSHRFGFDDAGGAYDVLAGDAPSLGILLEYPRAAAAAARTLVLQPDAVAAPAQPRVSFIGAGNYASRVLIPAFADAGAFLDTLVTSTGFTGGTQGRRAGFRAVSTEIDAVLGGDAANSVVIATRHDTHAGLAERALAAGKHVFVEKPLALTAAELESVGRAYRDADGALLMVGFNRRFAPLVVRMKALLERAREPKAIVVTVNAGAVPADHWIQDRAVGGGRIIGEACHFIDLLRHLVGHPVESWTVAGMDAPAGDTASIQLRFTDGSIGTIHYFANGNRRLPKERVEVYCGGATLVLDNFRRLHGYGWPGFRRAANWRQDKGQAACVCAFLAAIRDGTAAPIPIDQLIEVGTLSIEAAAALRERLR